MIEIKIPHEAISEYSHVFKIFFQEWSQIDYVIYPSDDGFIRIRVKDSLLTFPCLLKLQRAPKSLSSVTLPWHEEEFKICWGVPSFQIEGKKTKLAFDPLGQAFYILTGMENLGNQTRDQHDRDDIKNNFLYRNGLLTTPIVDQIADVLIKFVEINSSQKVYRSKFKTIVTTDIDHPFDPSTISLKHYLSESRTDWLKRRDLKLWSQRTLNLVTSKFGNYVFDPNNYFTYMGEVAKKSSVEFIAYVLNPLASHERNGLCARREFPQWILKLLIEQDCRIGLHGSYLTLGNAELLKKEKDRLEALVNNIKPGYQIKENRQHYLRWQDAFSPREMSQVGFERDSSIGSAFYPGFRTGTCREYSLWDHQQKKSLSVKELPLSVMESALIEVKGLNLSVEGSIQEAKRIKDIVKKYQGTFCLLWHQNRFFSSLEKSIFEAILD